MFGHGKGAMCAQPLPIGTRVGRLVLIKKLSKPKGHYCSYHYLCKCDCGKRKKTNLYLLRAAKYPSCGCWQTEIMRAFQLGENSGVRRHGHRREVPTPEYRAWSSMINLCTNPNAGEYHRYGGRGIRVCKAWMDSFEAFLKDVGLRPSPELQLGRINKNDGYKPGNVAWMTRSENAMNRPSAKLIKFKGEKRTIRAWAIHLGLCYETVWRRFKVGWTARRALEK